MVTVGRRPGRLRAGPGEPVDQPVPAVGAQRVAAAHGRRSAAAHRELPDADARCGGRGRRRRDRAGAQPGAARRAGPGRDGAVPRGGGHGDRGGAGHPAGQGPAGSRRARRRRPAARRARHPRAWPRRRARGTWSSAGPPPGRSASWPRTGSCTASRSSRASSSPATCCRTRRTPTTGLRTFGLVLGASALGFVLAVVLTPVLSPRTGPHVWIVLCLPLAAGQPAAARRLRRAHRRCSSPPASSAWRRRAPRSPSTRSCSATPTTPSAAARSRSTTSSTTRRSSAPPRSARSPCPTPATPRGCSSCSPSRTPGSPPCYGSASRGVPAVHATEARLAS